MTPEEIEKRRKALQEAATESICQRGKLEVLLDPEDIRKLLDQAHKVKKPLGVMIREWILTDLQNSEESE